MISEIVDVELRNTVERIAHVQAVRLHLHGLLTIFGRILNNNYPTSNCNYQEKIKAAIVEANSLASAIATLSEMNATTNKSENIGTAANEILGTIKKFYCSIALLDSSLQIPDDRYFRTPYEE
jgi:hypothetical protein